MKNHPETGGSTAIPIEETLAPTDPRIKLRDLLPNLTVSDASFVEFILELENSNSPTKQYTDLLTNIIDLIGNNPNKARKLMEERQVAQRVNMMEIMEPFNEKERRIITKNLRGIQMTDGCTVGCPWCGVEAKRGIDKAFSFKSFQEFMEKYGRFLPRNVNLYHSSDPFDWINEDGKHDYTSLAYLFLENTKNSHLLTSTAVPEGSELSIFNFLIFYYQRIRQKLKEKKEIDVNFRFSQTRNNKERINRIMQALKNYGISDEALKRIISIENRESDGNIELKEKGTKRGVRNVGFFVKHPARIEDSGDMLGIACKDSLNISPGGIVGKLMEAVTLRNSIGIRKTKVTPGQLEIPNFIDFEDYTFPLGRKANSFFQLLPKQTYRVYENGKFGGAKVIESVRRDALSFRTTLVNLEILSDIFLSPEGKEVLQKQPREIRNTIKALKEKFIPEFEERKRTCLTLFEGETDEQAKRITLSQIGKVEEWLTNIDANLGLETAKYYSSKTK